MHGGCVFSSDVADAAVRDERMGWREVWVCLGMSAHGAGVRPFLFELGGAELGVEEDAG
jgi:hypothetical protein